MKRFVFSLLLVCCYLWANADVLGPYITGQETSVEGYGRIVCVMNNTEYGAGFVTICDSDGNEYKLTAHANGGAPYCYLLEYGTYTVMEIGERCSVASNFNIAIGATFIVSSGGGYMTITKSEPAPKPYVYGPYLNNTSSDTALEGYCRTMIVPVNLNANIVLTPVNDTSTSFTLWSNFKTTNSEGTVVPFVYYILAGSYKVKSISSTSASYNYNLTRVYVGDVIKINYDNMFYLTE